MKIHATTVLAVKRGEKVAMAGDGQVTAGATVLKAKACKVRSMRGGEVLAGFAGGAADAFTLFELFEQKLDSFHGDLTRAAVELAKEWRTDKRLRRLEAMLLVANRRKLFLVSGNGDVIEPDEGVVGIGSGGAYAYAAAKAMLDTTTLPPAEIAVRALKIAGQVCIYTNQNVTVEELA